MAAEQHSTRTLPAGKASDDAEGAAHTRYDTAVHDLAGAASLASLLLVAIREDRTLVSGAGCGKGLAWLATRIGDAAENLLAVHECRTPQWNTTMEADEVAEALRAARLIGEARRTAAATSAAADQPAGNRDEA